MTMINVSTTQFVVSFYHLPFLSDNDYPSYSINRNRDEKETSSKQNLSKSSPIDIELDQNLNVLSSVQLQNKTSILVNFKRDLMSTKLCLIGKSSFFSLVNFRARGCNFEIYQSRVYLIAHVSHSDHALVSYCSLRTNVPKNISASNFILSASLDDERIKNE